MGVGGRDPTTSGIIAFGSGPLNGLNGRRMRVIGRLDGGVCGKRISFSSNVGVFPPRRDDEPELPLEEPLPPPKGAESSASSPSLPAVDPALANPGFGVSLKATLSGGKSFDC